MNNQLILEIKQIIQFENLDVDLNLSEDELIQEFEDKVNWYEISICQKLSEQFIDKFQDKVNWSLISECQKLSESLIEKHQDKLDWRSISECQKISESFIDKFQDKVHWDRIIKNNKIKFSNRFLVEFYKKGNIKIFECLKQKPGIKKYCKMIEQQVPVLILETNNQ